MIALALAGGHARAATLTRGPYLQVLTTDSVDVVWNTDTPAACSLQVRPTTGTAWTVPGETDTVCAISVTGLSRGMEYAYTPQADGTSLASESTFRTDDPASPFTFLAFGDSGSGNDHQLAVRDRLLAIPADFLLHTGDMIYDDGAASDFDPKFFVPYADLLRRIVLWPCLGNHDVHTPDGTAWRDAFITPANNRAGSERYYSFDFGNGHFVVLDSDQSTAPGSPQYLFLDAELAASTAVWNVVAFHHTIYSSGDHGSNLSIRSNLVRLFDRYSVDLVLMGHDHDYERTRPIRHGAFVAPGAGTIYVTTGGGGQDLRPVGTSDFTAYAEAAFHVTRVAVNGLTMTLDMVRVDGTVGDTITVVKDGPSPKCTTDADCDDGLSCTVDACRAGACANDAVLLGDARRAAANVNTRPECAGNTLTPTVGSRLARAAASLDRAEAATGTRLADRLIARAVRAWLSAASRAELAVRRGLLSSDCGNALAVALRAAQATGECLADRRAPMADTYVEAGKEADRNHGGATELSVDGTPKRLAYLAFDLSSLRGSVRRATLELHAMKPSTSVANVYAVAGLPWTEGVGSDAVKSSRQGPGLRFVDLDTNGDGQLDVQDGAPLVPDENTRVSMLGSTARGQAIRLRVTRAVQSGPGLYTFVIATPGTDGTAFASRENPTAGLRPMLRIVRDVATSP